MEYDSFLHAKRKQDSALQDLEAKIYDLEGKYLQDRVGNVVRGFAGFAAPERCSDEPPEAAVLAQQCCLSLSSLTSPVGRAEWPASLATVPASAGAGAGAGASTAEADASQESEEPAPRASSSKKRKR